MKSFLLANRAHGLRWAVVINPGLENESVHAVHEVYSMAINEVSALRDSGETADVMKITSDGSLTAEY